MRDSKGKFVKGTMYKDLRGQKFNYLTFEKFDHVVDTGKNRRTYWLCKCDCGKEVVLRADQVKSGNTKSCGCHKHEVDSQKANIILKKVNTKHGLSKTRLYSIYENIVGRCTNPLEHSYERYGGRGILICNEWLNDVNSFYDWAINNGYKDNLTIDRINNNGNYEPNNCRWANNITQCNNRRSNIKIKYKGKTQSLTMWCRELRLNYRKANHQYHKGISFEQIIINCKTDNTEVIP